jgi:integrase
MSKRRGNGEGSIYRRSDGQWTGSLSVRQPLGGRKRRVVYGKTQRDVQEKVAKLRGDALGGLPIITGRVTVTAVASQWLNSAEAGGLHATTLTRYGEIVRLHLLPTLGSVSAAQLSAADLQSLYAVKKRTLSGTTVHHIHRVAHTMLEQAVRWGYVARNVAHLIPAPKITRSEMKVWTREEARRFLTATEDDTSHALYVLALATGMRQGEILGLRWTDLDLDRGRVSVQKTLYHERADDYRLLEPKTASARRNLGLDARVIQALKRHRKAQRERRLQVGGAWSSQWNLVFATDLGQPLDGTSVTLAFQRATRQAGLARLRFHDLRHTCATILLQGGVHPKVVQEMLGHSTIAITLDTYSHVVVGMHDDASREMGRALFG